MGEDQHGIRGVVLAEDRRTERFIRHLLVALGYDKRRFRFMTAPSGEGAADAWVLAQYPPQVRSLRSRPGERCCLIAVRDGDNSGTVKRKGELDEALRQKGLAIRSDDERIAAPVPTWSVETWLLQLLGKGPVDENQSWKHVFERQCRKPEEEKKALVDAAKAWEAAPDGLPSLADGRLEVSRIA